MPLLLEIASREPNRIVFHCGAGLSRSISKLLMFIIFNDLIKNMSKYTKNEHIDSENFLSKVAKKFQLIRVCRPGAIGNNDLLTEAIVVALDMYKEQLKLLKINVELQWEMREIQNRSIISVRSLYPSDNA
jgi:hypothetical protein